MPEIKVKHMFVHQTPRKLRLVSDAVRGLPATRAAAELATLSQYAGQAVRKVILSGIAAAGQKGISPDALYVSQIQIDEGPKMRRTFILGRGRSSRFLKRMSHIIVSLSDEPRRIASSRAYKAELTKGKTGSQSVKPTAKSAKATPVKKTVEAKVAETAEGSR